MQYKVVHSGSADDLEKQLNVAASHDWRVKTMDIAKQRDGSVFYVAVMEKPAA